MLSHSLEVFLVCAGQGSFTRAASVLYMSPTAVMKQVNALENRLSLELFERSSQGLKLTKPGKVLYEKGLLLQKQAQEIVDEMQQAAMQESWSLKVGTSLLNPAKPFMDLWFEQSSQFPNCRLELVSFEDDHTDILNEIRQLGTKFDFLVGVCDSKLWLKECQFYRLGESKKMIAAARNHPLAQKKCLEVEDLHGWTLMMVKKGDSPENDRLREFLQTEHPQIRIEDTAHFYDIDVFNTAAASDKLLLNLECWKDVHPGLVSIPVNWDYSIPFGLLYSLNPPLKVRQFLKTLDQKEKPQQVRL